MKRPFLAAQLFFVFSSCSLSQCPASLSVNAPETVAWNGKLLDAISQENGCSPISTDAAFNASSACNIFVGRVLETVYGVTDFERQNPVPGNAYLRANDIGTLLQSGVIRGWTLLGLADDQGVLTSAKQSADQGTLVLAVYVNPNPSSPGHVALIGPGPMTPSSKWHLDTPVSSSFFLGQAARSFLGMPLSCAFSPDVKSAVKIWAKTS